MEWTQWTGRDRVGEGREETEEKGEWCEELRLLSLKISSELRYDTIAEFNVDLKAG